MQMQNRLLYNNTEIPEYSRSISQILESDEKQPIVNKVETMVSFMLNQETYYFNMGCSDYHNFFQAI